MRAVALSVLGPGPDVDDVVQDAAVTALRRVGDVRDPAAVGAWLGMIVRNASRSLLRSSVPVQPIDDLHLVRSVAERGALQWSTGVGVVRAGLRHDRHPCRRGRRRRNDSVRP
ncbi:RNA polymerase sigma factor [Streptomyces sp. OK228]|uniref:RNA polymerase sigma factor n=1 Tax=Streptomyces TaxID=1883 RepID=UPI00359CB563